ncbi:response regulator transcription factor [Niastella caeni]|uniref:Response regulator transcription factor n=1 Tax=Niastella caeni TaxID=2569763 RepID=A0A4S8HXC4_9BACT|nr:response regulator transcription factor [Niastella caeni]THU40145.1 response regulator transcription factor [Niastella caeni]
MKKFLIADDHFIVRSGIKLILKEDFINATVDECSDGSGVWEMMEKELYDLVIMDIHMPETDSVNLLKNIFSMHPAQKILIFTMSDEEIYAKKYLQLGVKGFINKDTDATEIRKAIDLVLNNKRYLSSNLQNILTKEAIEGKTSNPFDLLSSRELEVVTHLVAGKNISEIATMLSVHTSTIGTHKARILHKLGVSNIVELINLIRTFNVVQQS